VLPEAERKAAERDRQRAELKKLQEEVTGDLTTTTIHMRC
jgi:hypothetical protein